ncbi:AMP-binding enzyme domain-containing protein [Phthorimaea operculella]|nr:AMP-binding enzyme domain-containing protein [Phthorimaea operculella]
MTLLVAAVGAAFFAIWTYLGFLFTVALSITIAVLYLLVFHPRLLYVWIKTTPRDLYALSCYIRILWTTKKYSRKNWAIPDVFHETVQKHPKKPCFLFQDEVWTFQEVEEFSLRVTAALKAQGVKKGGIVGLLVNNCPQYPAMWMGIARIGAITPLININQKGNALVHSINVAKCDVLIFSDEYQSAVQDVASELSPNLKLFKFTHRPLNPANPSKTLESGDAVSDFTALLEATPPAPWTRADGDGFTGKLLYIYTSGTTGLPKAAVITNARFAFIAAGLHFWRLKRDDVVYCPLPLYHTAGGVISVGQALMFGCTVVVKSKFSASQYFPDCVKYRATALMFGCTVVVKSKFSASQYFPDCVKYRATVRTLVRQGRVYCPLLSHVISVGQALMFGCTVVVKSKFSASQYFPDCVKYRATALMFGCTVVVKSKFSASQYFPDCVKYRATVRTLVRQGRVYCPLLSHVISVGQALMFGCTVVVKSKFSASQYFPDCVKYRATALMFGCTVVVKSKFSASQYFPDCVKYRATVRTLVRQGRVYCPLPLTRDQCGAGAHVRLHGGRQEQVLRVAVLPGLRQV